MAPLAGGERGGTPDALVSVRSLEPTASLASSARTRARGSDLCLPAQDRLGAAACRRRDRLRALDRLEGAEAAGLTRPPRTPREPANSYEWPCPGDLLHMDTSEYVRFQKPGHRVTGDRSSQDRQRRDGVDFVHAIIDDHSRLAYTEIHPDQRARTVAAFLERALAFYAAHGITAKRLMTDNAWIYVRSRAVQDMLARNEIRHLTTKPYRPRTNGKVERFHQTMAREWAYGLYRTHRDRTAALPHWLNHYNRTRPHSSLGGRPPDQPRSQRPWAGQLAAEWMSAAATAARRLPGGSRSARVPAAASACLAVLDFDQAVAGKGLA